RREGLTDDRVNSMLDDGAGYFWIGCGRGIYRVEEKQLRAVAEGGESQVRCVTFGEADGILSPDTNGQESQPAAYKTRDGRLWFATCAGVVVIDPAKLHALEVAPSVVIERIRSNERTLFAKAPSNRGTKGLRSPNLGDNLSGLA